MYNCNISIFTFGLDERAVNVLSSVQPPEDCFLHFNATEADYPDRIFIFWDTALYLMNNDLPERAFTAVITDGKKIPEGVRLWVMPDGADDEKLLKTYFLQLINEVKTAFDCRRYRICLQTSLDSVPDLVWFKDDKGAHLIVNDEFCAAVEKTKEQIYKKGHYYIWDIPKEEYEQGDYVCLESEEIVMKAGKTCLFDEKVKTKTGMRQYKTYKSPLYDIDGKVFGTCGIAHDVTDLHKINSELMVVLESVPFGILLEDSLGNLVSANKALLSFFPGLADMKGKNCEEWKTIVMSEAEEAGSNEFAVRRNGFPRILKFSAESVFDIFGECIGKVTIFQDVTAERIFQRKTIEHANTDFLTGLNNRRSLFDYLDKIKNSRRISMITVDLDNFKKVNDTCGHKMGDDVLVETADILKTCFKNDFIARLGGDEFLVVITRDVSDEQLEKEGVSLINMFCNRFKDKSELAVMTVSAGIATAICPENGVINAESLMYGSDCALYEAKKEGKSRCCFYNG